MVKHKVFEIAKELMTESKQVILKLAEIGVEVKSSMSSITDEQMDELYKHLNISKKGESEDDNTVEKNIKKEPNKKTGPTIVRKREIYVNNELEEKPEDSAGAKRKSYIKKLDKNAGLRPGLAHDDGPKPGKKTKKNDKKTDKVKTDLLKPDVKADNEPHEEERRTGPILIKKKPKQEEVKTVNTDSDKGAVSSVVPKKEESGQSVRSTLNATVPDTDAGKDTGNTNSLPEKNIDKNIEKPVGKPVEKPAESGTGRTSVRTHTAQGSRTTGENPRYSGSASKERYGNTAGNNRDNRDKKPFRDKRDTRTPHTKNDIDIPAPVIKEEPVRSAEERGISRAKELERGVRREQKRDVKKPVNNPVKRVKPTASINKKELKGIVSYGQDYDDLIGGSGKKRRNRRPVKEEAKYVPPVVVITDLEIPPEITVKELAEMLKKTSAEIIKKLINLGLMATINTVIDFDTAALVLSEYGITATEMVIIKEEDLLFDDEDVDENDERMKARDPVVVVMGHVDHGKTSLLDAIRDAKIADGEAGGITQHIGAYKVQINNRKICFLDTPGHEAFTTMRARGAQVTDVAVIVVAADDSVMPQTIEAIDHAKAAGVKIVVAINKIDKEGANPDRVKTEMSEHGVVPAQWGGDTEFVEISAKKQINIDELLEIIILESDILNLKADPDRQAKGTVIEAKLDKNRGPVATILVQRGTLNAGDTIVTGTAVGRIRQMMNDKGKLIKKAGPSTPVEISGLPNVPEAGELFYAVTDEKMAKQLAEKRRMEERERQLKTTSKVSLEELYARIREGDFKELNIIVKADVQGSVEAVKQSMEKLKNDEVRVKVIHGGVGAISESDVSLAQVSNAIICGFNVRPGMNVAEMARVAGVDIRMYRVIYNAIEDIEAAMRGMLKPTYKEAIIGHAEIRQVYKVSGIGSIAGCYVQDGKIVRNAEIRLLRDSIVITEGKMNSLKRFKDDVREVAAGFECGITLERYNDIKEGDVIEAFIMEEIPQ